MNDFHYQPPTSNEQSRPSAPQEHPEGQPTQDASYSPSRQSLYILTPSDMEQGGYRPMGMYEQPLNSKANGYAIASFVLGLVTLLFTTCCCCMFFLAIVTGVLAIIFSVLSKKQNQNTFHGLALTGMILAIFGLLLAVLLIAMFATGAVNTTDFATEIVSTEVLDTEQI